MSRMLLGLVVGLGLVVPSVARAQARWLELKTPHFTVMTNSSERDARRVAGQFERMRAMFHTIMPGSSDDPASPIVVLALKDKKSFTALEPAAYLARNQLQLAGLFVRAQDRNYVLVRLDDESDHPFATVYHEYTHYIFRKDDAWMPLWLTEGLAEFYQNARLTDDKDVRVGEPSADDILYLRQNKLLPLTTLLTVDHSSPYYHDEQKGSVFYAEAWALTHYIEITDQVNHTHRLQDYAKYLRQDEDSVTAAKHAFGDLNVLQKELDSYVSQSSFKEFKLLVPVNFSEASAEVRPMPGPEADAVRAGVLLSVQRGKEAEELLNAVLVSDPQSAAAHETMGMLKFSEGDQEGAKKWFAEAVKLDSKSYLAQYYFGVMSLSDPDHGQDEAIEKSLQAAIQLNPRFAPAYDALAHFYASRHEKLEVAHKMNVKAVELEPESLPYRMNTAQVLMEDGKMPGAVSVLKAALPWAKTPGEKAMVEGRIAQMESYAAAMSRPELQTQTATATRSDVTSSVHDNTVVVMMDAGDGSGAQPVKEPVGAKVPAYPVTATGAKRTVSGVLRGVSCAYPTVLTLTLDRPAGPVKLYTNNYFKVQFTTANYNPTSDILPCTGIEGMKAKVVYGEVADERVAGQIVSIELSR